MRNYQQALLDGIQRHIERGMPFLDNAASNRLRAIADAASLFVEDPPQPVTDDVADEPAALTRLVRKFDPAARDARNRELGQQGEEHVLHDERSRLTRAERPDLAAKVRWVSQEDGDGAGYDIRSFSPAGQERLLEVKTTVGHKTTPFYLTENERQLSEERPDAFRIVRLFDFIRQPRVFRLKPPLGQWVRLQPTNYRASFEP